MSKTCFIGLVVNYNNQPQFTQVLYDMCLAKHLLVLHQIGSQYLDCQSIQNIFMNISLQSIIYNPLK